MPADPDRHGTRMRAGVLDPVHVTEILSVLVPLVAERAAYDAFEGEQRRRVATFDQRRGASTEEHAPSSAVPIASRSVHVRVSEQTVGELVVWRHGSPTVVEEALVVVTAERIADAIELAELRARSPAAAVLTDSIGRELRGPLQTIGFGLELLRARTANARRDLPLGWLLERLEGMSRAVDRIMRLADDIPGATRSSLNACSAKAVELR